MTAVYTTLIAGGFTVLVALIERSRRQNHREHGDTAGRIDEVSHSLGRIEQKIDSHLDGHGS